LIPVFGDIGTQILYPPPCMIALLRKVVSGSWGEHLFCLHNTSFTTTYNVAAV